MQMMSGRRGFNEVGVQPIPISEFLAFIDSQDFTKSQKDHVLNIFTTMDDIIVEDSIKKNKKEG